MKSLKNLWDNYGIGAVLIILFVCYVLYLIVNYLSNKSASGSELMSSNMNPAYGNARGTSNGPVPSDPLGENSTFASANGIQSQMVQNSGTCSNPNIQNPSDLLPNTGNSQWSELNPAGKGELANINFLKSGYHIGIDTIGQSLRNANLQIRSEPPNPQLNTGPWNQSTITPDFIRPPLEIGNGPQ